MHFGHSAQFGDGRVRLLTEREVGHDPEAGLCTGAGVGLAVLWRTNPSWKQNLFITGLTWAAGAFVGVAMQVVVAVFA